MGCRAPKQLAPFRHGPFQQVRRQLCIQEDSPCYSGSTTRWKTGERGEEALKGTLRTGRSQREGGQVEKINQQQPNRSWATASRQQLPLPTTVIPPSSHRDY